MCPPPPPIPCGVHFLLVPTFVSICSPGSMNSITLPGSTFGLLICATYCRSYISPQEDIDTVQNFSSCNLVTYWIVSFPRPWCESTLHEACKFLMEEISLAPSAPGGMVEYRRSLVTSFFFKFFLTVLQQLTPDQVSEKWASAVNPTDRCV